ncbi:hypothetical protein GE061_013495 [Apolygus lucorum]|uniref:Uncharacterized protein n=1 Tax=Apolygus lucorum TaxID=248454 RepID=A0A6A4K5M4_APOLU|nr:hypothetical protein GE061_013495 [Apolygus lucorum]
MKFVLIFAFIAVIVMTAFASPYTPWDSSQSESDNISSNATHSSGEMRRLIYQKNLGGPGQGGQQGGQNWK